MSKYQLAWNATTRKAIIQNDGVTLPDGSINAGTFDHDDSSDGLGPEVNHVLYQHVQNLLYKQGWTNMQVIGITQDGTVVATNFELNTTSVDVIMGDSEQLSAIFTPDGSSGEVTWSTADATIATVDDTGKITPVKVGTVNITATMGSITQTCAVTVQAPTVAVESVKISPETGSIAVGATIQLGVGFTPTDATNKTGQWSTSDTLTATVDDSGLVTGVKAGAVTIYFTSTDGAKKDTAAITVTAAS